MNQRLQQLIMAGFASLILVGCEGVMPGKESEPDDQAAVEERGAAAEDDARAAGLAGEAAFAGHPLDDPASPLSTRVVYFDFDESDIKPEFREVLEAHAQYLASHPSAAVTLEGHCDERGTREYNVALGERRANAVRRLMGLLGASEGQTDTISYGEERPAALGHDESSWALNRRVEIVYRAR